MVTIKSYQGGIVANPQSPVGVAAPQSAMGEELGRGLQKVGQALYDWQDEADTAQAKMADTKYADLIRNELYGDGTGFMYASGSDAMGRRGTVAERLKAAQDELLTGLSPAARARAQTAIQSRYQGALQSVDQHTAGEGRTYLNDASQARITMFANDAIYKPDQASVELQRAEVEISDMAARNGWSPEVTAVERQKIRTQVHSNIISRLEGVDPLAAVEYLRANKDDMAGAEVAKLENILIPRVQEYRGRQIGRAASGDISPELFRVANDTLGLDENAQREALQEYMKNGGQNIDPATTAWCAAYVNATLAHAGVKGTGSFMARSFLNWGQPVEQPQKGDIVVLSRGDPSGPSGHVGIFDGMNEDGTIRILGGNQGNRVSIATYSTENVLGYRRAAAAEGVGGGLAELVNIENPVEREAAIQEYNLRVGVQSKMAEAAKEEAGNAAFQIIEQGGMVDGLPLQTRQYLGREQMSALRSYESSLASGRKPITDDSLYVELSNMAASDPEAFMAADPILWRNQLDDADFQKFTDLRRNMITGTRTGTGSEASISAVRTSIKTVMEAAGIDGSKPAGAKTQLKLEADMLRWTEEFAKANDGRMPNAQEINKRAMAAVTPVTINPPGLNNEQAGYSFDINFAGQPVVQDGTVVRRNEITVETLTQSGVSIGGLTVPPGEIAAFAQEYVARYGVEPTPQEVIEGLAASGRYTQ